MHASADEHADLHWALRGGGGNFGVVTSFELRLHALGPEVFGLNVAYPIEDAARVLAGWRDAVADAPDELSTAGFVWSMPVVDELPEELRGAPYVGVVGMWAGDPADGERATRALRELATLVVDERVEVLARRQRRVSPLPPAPVGEAIRPKEPSMLKTTPARSRGPIRRALLAALPTVIAATALSSAAEAATVAANPRTPVLGYGAAPEEINQVFVRVDGDKLVISENTAPLTAGNGCTRTLFGSVECPIVRLRRPCRFPRFVVD